MASSTNDYHGHLQMQRLQSAVLRSSCVDYRSLRSAGVNPAKRYFGRKRLAISFAKSRVGSSSKDTMKSVSKNELANVLDDHSNLTCRWSKKAGLHIAIDDGFHFHCMFF